MIELHWIILALIIYAAWSSGHNKGVEEERERQRHKRIAER